MCETMCHTTKFDEVESLQSKNQELQLKISEQSQQLDTINSLADEYQQQSAAVAEENAQLKDKFTGYEQQMQDFSAKIKLLAAPVSFPIISVL